MYHFTRTNDFGREQFVVVAGGELYTTATGAALTKGAALITPGADNLWTFANFQDTLFACGGTDTDSFWYWDGTAGRLGDGTNQAIILENTLAPVSIHPKFVLQKWGRLYVAGMNPPNPDNTYNRMIVRYNEIGQDPTPTGWTSSLLSWPLGNSIGTGENVGDTGGLSDYGDEYITGLTSYTDPSGDWMMICTNRGLASVRRLADGRHHIDASTDTGLVNQHAWANLGKDAGDAVYMSENGIHSLRQSRQFGAREDAYLSWKIRNTFNSLDRSRFPYVSSGYDQQEGYVIFLVSGPNNTGTHDMLLCLDTRGTRNANRLELTADSAKWHIWELGSGYEANLLRVVRDPAGIPRLYAGTTDGDVGHLTRTIYSDFTTGSYPCRFQTAHASFGAPWLEKSAGDMTLDIQPGGDYMPEVFRVFDLGARQGPTISLDMGVRPTSLLGGSDLLGSTFVLGSTQNDTFRKHLYATGAGSTVGLRFEHTSPNQPFFIANISQQIGGLGEAGSVSTLTGTE
jgi:hypothetical protein